MDVIAAAGTSTADSSADGLGAGGEAAIEVLMAHAPLLREAWCMHALLYGYQDIGRDLWKGEVAGSVLECFSA